MKKFFLDQDNDCHWYLIPVENRSEWQAWREIPEHEPAGWTVPPFAKELGSHPDKVEFENPITKP